MLLQDTLDLFGQDSAQDVPREKEPVDLPSVEGGGLYVIRLSEKHYYGGRTSSFARRWESHLKELLAGNHGNPYMQGVFNKFGVFEPEALAVIPNTEDQVSAEQAWLDANIGEPGCVNLNPWASGGVPLGLIGLTLAGRNIRVPPERVPELLAQGWERGWVGRGANLGRVVLTRNGKLVFAPPEEVDGLLSQGWVRGLPEHLKGLVWVRSPDGTRSKVSPEKAQELLAQGWERGPGTLPSRNWVHRTSGQEIERRQVSDEDLQDFLDQGWAQGSALPNTAGLVWVHKEGEPDRRILEEDLECFLGLGWELGQGRFQEPHKRIRRVTEEGCQFRMVPSGELADWEQRGWEQGHLAWTPEVREKVVASWTPEKREAARLRRQNQENTTRGSVWVNDGVKNKRVSEEGALELLEAGWVRGQIHRKAHGPMSAESRARVSEAHRKSWARRGGMSEEGKQNLREKALQRHLQNPEKWATSDEKRAACSRSSAGRTWLTDGVTNKFANPEEATELLGTGWVRGQAQKSA